MEVYKQHVLVNSMDLQTALSRIATLEAQNQKLTNERNQALARFTDAEQRYKNLMEQAGNDETEAIKIEYSRRTEQVQRQELKNAFMARYKIESGLADMIADYSFNAWQAAGSPDSSEFAEQHGTLDPGISQVLKSASAPLIQAEKDANKTYMTRADLLDDRKMRREGLDPVALSKEGRLKVIASPTNRTLEGSKVIPRSKLSDFGWMRRNDVTTEMIKSGKVKVVADIDYERLNSK